MTNEPTYIAAAAGLTLTGTSIHEFLYHHNHPYASGPSTVMAISFSAAALLAFTVAYIAHQLASDYTRRTDQERQAQADAYNQSIEGPTD